VDSIPNSGISVAIRRRLESMEWAVAAMLERVGRSGEGARWRMRFIGAERLVSLEIDDLPLVALTEEDFDQLDDAAILSVLRRSVFGRSTLV
jgi:hypothetical protein